MLFRMLNRRSFAAIDKLAKPTLSITTYNKGKLKARIDITSGAPVVTKSIALMNSMKTGMSYLKSTLLPNGYPHTTKSQYLPYMSHMLITSCCNSTMNFMNTQALFVVLGGYFCDDCYHDSNLILIIP